MLELGNNCDGIISGQETVGPEFFLLDKGILAQLAAAAELSLTDTVLEIGPGSGNLTVELARRAGAVIAVETDRDLEPVLAANLSEFDNIQVIWGGTF